MNRSMGLVEWSLLLALSTLWGGSFFFVGVAVEALPPLTIVALRVGLAAIALNIFSRVVGVRIPKGRKLWTAFFVMGFLNNLVPFSLIVWGQVHIASGLASILNATTPLFTVIVAHFLTADEKITKRRISGVFAGILGTVIMIGPGAVEGIGASMFAQLAVLGAAISYAFAGIFGRRFQSMGVAPVATATGQVTASTIMLIPMAIVFDRPWILPMPDLEIWSAILALALLSTALAYVLYFRILATAGATNLLLVTFLIPVSAVLLGITILGERLELKHFSGISLIAIGLAAIDGRVFDFLRLKMIANLVNAFFYARTVPGSRHRARLENLEDDKEWIHT